MAPNGQKPESRLRFVGMVIQPQLMLDDGDNLVPFPVDPFQVSAAQWPDVQTLFDGAFAELRERLAAQHAEAVKPQPNRAQRRVADRAKPSDRRVVQGSAPAPKENIGH